MEKPPKWNCVTAFFSKPSQRVVTIFRPPRYLSFAQAFEQGHHCRQLPAPMATEQKQHSFAGTHPNTCLGQNESPRQRSGRRDEEQIREATSFRRSLLPGKTTRGVESRGCNFKARGVREALAKQVVAAVFHQHLRGSGTGESWVRYHDVQPRDPERQNPESSND